MHVEASPTNRGRVLIYWARLWPAHVFVHGFVHRYKYKLTGAGGQNRLNRQAFGTLTQIPRLQMVEESLKSAKERDDGGEFSWLRKVSGVCAVLAAGCFDVDPCSGEPEMLLSQDVIEIVMRG